MDGGQEVSCRFVITRRNSAELFELTKEVLDEMTRPVPIFVVVALHCSIRLGRNHGRFSGLRQGLEHPFVGIIALVCDDDGRGESGQQRIRPFQITGLSRRQQKTGRMAQGIDGGVNLRAQPTLAASESLRFAFFF